MSQAVITDKEERWLNISTPIRVTDGIADEPEELLWQSNTFVVSTLVVERSFYEKVGGYFDSRYGTDLEICSRLFVEAKKVGFLSRPYIGYRIHTQQNSASSEYIDAKDMTKDSLFYMNLVIRNIADIYANEIYYRFSYVASVLSHIHLNKKKYQKSIRQAIWAFRLYPSRTTLKNLLFIGGILFTKLWLYVPAKLYGRITELFRSSPKMVKSSR
jgi:hypothetical protein